MTSPKQRRLHAMEMGGYDLSGHHEDWVKNADYTRYNPDSGEILSTGSMSIGALHKFEAEYGHTYLRQASQIGVHYVDVSGVKPRRRTRTTCPASLKGYALTGLPVPCTVEIIDYAQDASLIQCDEPDISLDFDYPGRYTATVRSIPHTDGVFTIEVS